MKREWKPGEVALVNGRVCIRKGVRTWEHGDDRAFPYHDEPSLDIRPLVVIDPEDREQVERFYQAWADLSDGHAELMDEPWTMPAMRVRQALRSLIAPPKPDEPTGLGAVVEDERGKEWVRVGRSELGPRAWAPLGNVGYPGGWMPYAEIDVAHVHSTGADQ